MKNFVGNPEHILGSELTKHGEIAEHAQVNIFNARKIIDGLKTEYTFEGVGRLAPEDYLHNTMPVQAKFIGGIFGNNSFAHVVKHFNTYPDYITNGGIYELPKDQYENIVRYLRMSRHEIELIPSGQESGGTTIRNLVKNIREWENQNSVKFEDAVKPSIVDYKDVQLWTIDETIINETNSINETNQKHRNEAYQQSRPTLQEGLKATAVSAAVEGGMSFALGVAKKLKSGKKLNEFTEQDWSDVGLDTAKETGKGAIRGASIYGLTNFTAMPAAVASALVTATFGIAAQAQLLHQGEISEEDFIINSEVICLDVAVSAISSVMGQVLIPIPVLGAVVGNAAGMFMYGIAKDKLSKQETELIANFNGSIQALNERLDEQHRELIEILNREFAKFKSIAEFAFDLNVNIAFAGSVALLEHVGCDDKIILKDKESVDTYFLS